MTEQPALFDPASTMPRECPQCPATLQPGEQRTDRCQYELDGRDGRRPRHCLNSHRPEEAEIPF